MSRDEDGQLSMAYMNVREGRMRRGKRTHELGGKTGRHRGRTNGLTVSSCLCVLLVLPLWLLCHRLPPPPSSPPLFGHPFSLIFSCLTLSEKKVSMKILTIVQDGSEIRAMNAAFLILTVMTI